MLRKKKKEEEREENDMNTITTVILAGGAIAAAIVVAAVIYNNYSKEAVHKNDKYIPPLSEEEKRKIEEYLKLYEQEVKHSFVRKLSLELFLPSEISDNLERKYPAPQGFNPYDLADSVDLDKPSVEEYILSIARDRFGIKNKEELLKKERYTLGALKELIKESSYREIIKEIEPYINEENREDFERLKNDMPPIFM